jgi:hypothetical protein
MFSISPNEASLCCLCDTFNWLSSLAGFFSLFVKVFPESISFAIKEILILFSGLCYEKEKHFSCFFLFFDDSIRLLACIPRSGSFRKLRNASLVQFGSLSRA